MPALTSSDVQAPRDGPDDVCSIEVQKAVSLATDVYLPARRPGRGVPALLVRTPYGRRGEIDRVAELARYFREHGIAVVVQDVRGRYGSDGELRPFVHELGDGHATAEWVAGQSWSSGAVVPFGDSYAGFTAWAAAASGHGAIKGAVVRVTTPDIGPHWMYRQGAFRLQMNAQWAAFAWGGREAIDVQPDWSVRPLAGIDFQGADMSAFDAWLRASSSAGEWSALVGTADASWRSVAVPVLHWGGWWDLMSRGQIAAWESLRATSGQEQRLLMTATDHSFDRFPPDPEAAAAPLDAQYDEVAAFVTDSLRGGHGRRASIRYEVTHDGWRESDGWPPSATVVRRLYLVDAPSALFGPEGGGLSWVAETVPSTVMVEHDPVDAVPSLETFVWGTLANAYPDERDAQVRDDVATFSGTPVDEPLEIAGPIALQLSAGTSGDVGLIAATLSDVRPDGTAWRIAEGASLVDGNGSGRVVVDLGPVAYRLATGHRLRVAVAGSSFPRYLWACRDLVSAWNGELGKPYELSLRVGVDSYLEVPLCP